MVFTINPAMISDFNALYREKDIDYTWDQPVPGEIMEQLIKIPYFVQGYEEFGIKEDEFVDQPAFQYTANEFKGSMKFIEEYVAKRKST